MDAAGAADAQLGDVDLLSRVGEDERRKLEAKRAQSTALLERATELIRSLEREAAETSDGKSAAMREELQVLQLQIESIRDENLQLQAELARVQSERDEAIETRDVALPRSILGQWIEQTGPAPRARLRGAGPGNAPGVAPLRWSRLSRGGGGGAGGTAARSSGGSTPAGGGSTKPGDCTRRTAGGG